VPKNADGFFFVTGRIKELIIKGGENIAPREIDEVLLAHPAVLEAAATGLPDRHYGQEILACIVLRPGMACAEDELRAFCVEKLGRYKTPRELRFVRPVEVIVQDATAIEAYVESEIEPKHAVEDSVTVFAN